MRDTGLVGSVCTRGIFEPTVANAFSVDNAKIVAGAPTNAVTVVNRFSALALAASKASRFAHAPPLAATAVVKLPKPFGPWAVVLPKKLASS